MGFVCWSDGGGDGSPLTSHKTLRCCCTPAQSNDYVIPDSLQRNFTKKRNFRTKGDFEFALSSDRSGFIARLLVTGDSSAYRKIVFLFPLCVNWMSSNSRTLEFGIRGWNGKMLIVAFFNDFVSVSNEMEWKIRVSA